MGQPASEKVVNIINFIRCVEPRVVMDLEESVREQMTLAKKYSLPTTWLLQYDSLCSDFYVPFLKENMPASHEVGIWFEIVQPQVEAAGLKWRGRYSWDWHSDKAFSVGYTLEERIKLADVMMEKFKSCFGFYPRVMGAWFFDAQLLAYLQEKYGLDAACNCKDQFGTDGYTLWGGYWANGYYASKKNSYLPACNAADQIPVPIFRMLGSDPIYQYSADLKGLYGDGQSVITLEPVYTGYGDKPAGGGNPEWCDWFFKENFNEENLNYSYAQAGQENSFGWPNMANGLRWQYRRISELNAAGKLRVETLGESGRKYKARFPQTPTTTVVVRDDWRGDGHETFWYLSRLNRLNFFRDNKGMLVLRDFHTWSDNYAEPFLNAVCKSNVCQYDALPIIEGMLWKSGLRFFPGGAAESGKLGKVSYPDETTAEFEWEFDRSGKLGFRLGPGCMRIDASAMTQPCTLEYTFDPELAAASTKIGILPDGAGWTFSHNGMDYCLRLNGAKLEAVENGRWLIKDVRNAVMQVEVLS